MVDKLTMVLIGTYCWEMAGCIRRSCKAFLPSACGCETIYFSYGGIVSQFRKLWYNLAALHQRSQRHTENCGPTGHTSRSRVRSKPQMARLTQVSLFSQMRMSRVARTLELFRKYTSFCLAASMLYSWKCHGSKSKTKDVKRFAGIRPDSSRFYTVAGKILNAITHSYTLLVYLKCSSWNMA